MNATLDMMREIEAEADQSQPVDMSRPLIPSAEDSFSAEQAIPVQGSQLAGSPSNVLDMMKQIEAEANGEATANQFDPLSRINIATAKLKANPGLQNIKEFGKGIPVGAIELGGLTLKGAAGITQGGRADADKLMAELQRVPQMTDAEVLALRKRAMAILPTGSLQAFQGSISDIQEGNLPSEATDIRPPMSGPRMTENPLFKAGGKVQKFARELLPAAPGYENSTGRNLGEGVGTVVAGVTLAALSPYVSAGAFALSGAGEAVERAVKSGATEQQIIAAAKAGLIPGLTDSAPVELLRRGLNVPLPYVGPVLKVISRIGAQAFIEGVQEGGQEYLQNLIAKEVYKPGQDMTENIVPSAGLGAGVGAIVETLATPLRRRGGRRTPDVPVNETPIAPPESPQDGQGVISGTPTPEIIETPSGESRPGNGTETLSMMNRIDAEEREGMVRRPAKADDLGRASASVSQNDDRHAAAGIIDPAVKPDNGTLAMMNAIDAETQAMEAGSKYVGFVDDSQNIAAAEGATDEAPMHREAVLGPLMKAFGVPLYQGRIKGNKRLGFFRSPVEEVRIKNANDLETTTHEIAHLLDSRVAEVKAAYQSKEFKEEVRSVSYDKTKLNEGFAEFVRLWSTQRDEAHARAPKFAAWFDEFVERSEYGPALKQAQEQAHRWFDQSALNRAKSKIGAGPEINAHLNTMRDRFRQSVTDDLHGIYAMEREMTGGIQPAGNNQMGMNVGGAYETARLSRASHSIAEGALTIGAPKVNADGSHSFAGNGLKQILDPVAQDLDNFLLYSVGRSANELMGQGRENLFTRAEIQAMQQLESPAFAQAFDEYQTWNKAVLDFAQAKGLISGEDRSKWQRAQYIPFHRVGQKTSGKTQTAGEWSGIKALTGGSENIQDVLGNMIQNSVMLIDAALKNEARLEVAKLARKEGGAKFMARIPTDDKMVTVSMREVRKGLYHAMGVDPDLIPPEIRTGYEVMMDSMAPFARFLIHNQSPRGDDIVAVMQGGKPTFYQVADPILYRSLVALNRPARGWLMKLAAAPRRIGQASVTLSPDFMLANVLRDTVMGGVMSRHGFKPFIDSMRGFKSRITSDQNYKDFIANGGGFSSYFVDENAFKTHLEKFYSSKGIDYKTVLDSPAKLLFAVERMADAFEMSTRLGEFSKARKQGEHPRHAAYSGREVSTDFAMRGDNVALGFMFDTIMFLKAGINGLDRSYRGYAHDPNRMAIAGKTAILAAVSAGLWAYNKDIPEYDQLEDWDKDTNWHFFIPKEAGGYHHFRYPKIWEIGAVASVAERQLEGLVKGQPLEAQVHTLRVFKELFKLDVIPQFVKPFAEQVANKNFFTGRPIETMSMESKQPWDRYSPYGSRALRAAGEASRDMPRGLQINPARTEALLRGFLNTWAHYGLLMVDGALFDDMPDLRIDQYPGIRRLYRQQPNRSNRYVREFYDVARESIEVRRTMRSLDRAGRPELAAELEDKFANRIYGQMSRAQRHMRAINSEMRRVLETPDVGELHDFVQERGEQTRRPRLVNTLSSRPLWNDIGALKRWLLDDLAKERNRFAEEIMKDVEARKREEKPASQKPKRQSRIPPALQLPALPVVQPMGLL